MAAAAAVWSWACTAALAAAPGPGVLDFSAAERARIASHGPWPPAPARDASNPAQGRAAAAAWGRALFFDTRLSADGRFACATCHLPARAFQDGLATALQRDGPALRNTPGLQDSGGRRWLGWGGEHDSLWAASLAPLFNAQEMAHTPASLAARLRAEPMLGAGYRRAFGRSLPADDEAVAVDVARALAAFQATLGSPRTAFDDFRDAMQRSDWQAAAQYPLAAQRGLRLFVGEARCSVCHAGPAFTNGEFADIGVPFFAGTGVDAGRHAGLRQLQASRHNRLGPYNAAGATDPQAVTTRHLVIEPRHFGEFRVPGLRQLVHTAPYMHAGSHATLAAVVQHYSELDENRLHADGERILRPLRLSAGDAADLEAFLRSLSEPARSTRPPPTPR